MTTDRKAEEAKYEILHTRTAHTGWARFLVATVRLPDGRTIEREIEDHGDAVCVLAYHPGRKTAIMIRQARASVLFASDEQETLEAIAGVIEHEDPGTCAHREAKEEAQLELDSLEHIFTAWTMPGISTERMHFYLAAYAGEARPDIRGGVASEDEETIAVEIGLAALVRMAESGELADVKTLLALQTLRLRQPHLFEP
jgi:nudix-type nucleoside diphosphatase (YffH/AdpP family)